MTAQQRKTVTTVLALIGAPFAVWALTAATSAVGHAWDGKETKADHAADMSILRAERARGQDSIHAQHALDSAFNQRLLDAICADRSSIRACKP